MAGCERWPAPAVTANEVERSAVVEPAPPRAVAPTWSPRTRYAAELRDRAPEDADRWMAAADRALASPVDLTLPVRERVAWVAREVEAVAYAFELPEGRAFELRLDEAFEGFVDLFFQPRTDEGFTFAAKRVAQSENTGLTHVVREPGRYVVRLQAQVGFDGARTLELGTSPSLVFPVQGKNARAIQSFFGAPRESGRRAHHGVDIFAPRGTPVVAAADGSVRVGVNRLGGNVVWQYDEGSGHYLYYAHLLDTAVRSGEHVSAGTVLGRVGTSGNAQGGAPHLHFGIYGRGPLDPLPYVDDRARKVPDPAPGDLQLGAWSRVVQRTVLRRAPDARAEAGPPVDTGTAARLLAVRGTWGRVQLPDGSEGWLQARRLRAAERPLASFSADAPLSLFARPDPASRVTAVVPAGAIVEVLARAAAGQWVRVQGGDRGWLLATL